MNAISDPDYARYADLDLEDAKPVSDIPALAQLQAEQGGKTRITIRVDNATLSIFKARGDDGWKLPDFDERSTPPGRTGIYVDRSGAGSDPGRVAGRLNPRKSRSGPAMFDFLSSEFIHPAWTWS
jgi:hypothetical protein